MWCGTDEVSSVSSRYSSTSTLCDSVVELPVVSHADAPPPLPPRQPRRESSHGPRESVSHGSVPGSPFDTLSPPLPPLPPPLLPVDDSSPPLIPPRIDLLPPPLPPRQPTSVVDPSVPPGGPARRRHTAALPARNTATPATLTDGVPQLPPKTYLRQLHVRQSSS